MIAADIIRRIAIARGMPYAMLRSPNRTKHVSRARHEAMWLIWRLLSLSTPAIAREVGRRDHTTVLHGLRRVQRDVKARPEYDAELRAIVFQG